MFLTTTKKKTFKILPYFEWVDSFLTLTSLTYKSKKDWLKNLSCYETFFNVFLKLLFNLSLLKFFSYLIFAAQSAKSNSKNIQC